MRKIVLIIPIMTFLANITILLNIPVLREIVVFVFLSFVPGFAILGLFKLRAISFLETVLFSVGLSIASVMFIGLLVNELYLALSFSDPLSSIPLTLAISAFALTVFFIQYRRDLSEALNLKTSFEGMLKDFPPLAVILVLLPLISAIGVIYLDVSVILLSYAIIAALCVLSVASRKLIPEKLFPFLILSISIALVCQVPLTSKYIVGFDSNLEYYVFRLTQINGHWGFLNSNVNALVTLNYNSMLSITLLPAIYANLMSAQGEIVFKILYPFIFSLVPLTLFVICEKQFGKLIGLLSVLFFVFTYTAFYGPEPLGLNRQIVGELFLVLSVFLLISKTIPVTKRRLLLIIFGAAIVVSHYSIAYIYLALVTLVFVTSKLKPRFNDTLNTATILILFSITFSWYAIGFGAPLKTLADTVGLTIMGLLKGNSVNQAGTASSMFAVSQAITTATWINILLSGLANLFIIMGFLSIILKLKKTRVSAQFEVMLIVAGIVLAVSLIFPNIAATLNFTRFYGITLLFLCPCFVLGGQTILEIIEKVWKKIKIPTKFLTFSASKNVNGALLLVAIIMGGYFLSQSGFVNNVTNDAIHSYTVDFKRMNISNEIQVKINLYDSYIPEQDVFSASWLQRNKVPNAEVFADYESEFHVLESYGLIPTNLINSLTECTVPPQGSFVYLGTQNIANGVITTTSGSFNTSQISVSLERNDLIYSNGNSEIWYVPAR